MRTDLFQFHISSYCEKTRWALDFKGIRYRKVSFIPGFHIKRLRRLSGQTSVPVLRYGRDVVSGSDKILDFLETIQPEHPLLPSDPVLARQVREWESRLDDVGADVRLWSYHHLLASPALALPLLGSGQPFYKRWLLKAVFPKMEKIMRRWMKIDASTAAAAQARIEAMLQELRACYSQRHFLAGEHFSRADLTACAMFAPLFMPAEYPVPWPARETLPAPMLSWLNAHDHLLEPLRIRYAQYR
ncbi:glutathione S-transferase family protein [Thalassolituus sp. LLYu03]|uniref:glutathione S-transferase family protein n=1 Tax=Thalassolituus sp. LLYu03 TaxID=3421656 RepID=UPI003D2C69D4